MLWAKTHAGMTKQEINREAKPACGNKASKREQFSGRGMLAHKQR